MATFELYRRSTVGMCLTETLDQMVSGGVLSPELAIQVLIQFDKSMTEALENEVKTKVTIKAKVFHYGSISLIVEPCRSTHLKAMEVARDSGALLSYDPNLRLPLWPSAEEAREQIMSIWEKADIIKVSDEELSFLVQGDADDKAAMSLYHDNLKLLLVTLGEKGCRYYTKHFRGEVDSFRVNTVDTTGAGDSFLGALLCKIVGDQSIIEV